MYWEVIIGFSGLFIGYITSYLKIKGKNKALLEDNQKLTNQIEEIKQDYALDLQKRKYKYETKEKLYYKFMDKLDTYHSVQIHLLFNELREPMMKFYESKTIEEKEKWTIEFNNKAGNIDIEIKKQVSELFSQLNQLKLTVGKEALSLIGELQNELNMLNIRFSEMANNIPLLLDNPSMITELQEKDKNPQVIIIKKKLIEVLKNELDQI